MHNPNRPGARQCDRCKGLYPYSELEAVPRANSKRILTLCEDCRRHLARLQMIRWP